MTGSPPPDIELRQVMKSFRSGSKSVNALREVDLCLYPGEFVSLIGPSGCGKSTVLRLVAGLIYPSAGEVRFRGNSVTDVNSEIGFITQQSRLFPWMTLLDNVIYALRARGISRDRAAAQSVALLEKVGLAGFERYYPHELSGGMQKRASLVRTLIYKPRVILMDEPYGEVDAQMRLLLQDELLNLWQEERLSVIFVTHDIVESIALSDRVVVMSARPGRVKAEVKIDIPRPRDVFNIHDAPGFSDVYGELWGLMREEIGL